MLGILALIFILQNAILGYFSISVFAEKLGSIIFGLGGEVLLIF